MVTAQFNYFDIAVLSIMFLSCIFALFRGFVKEVLSLVAWVGSAYITIRFYKPLSAALQPHFVNPMAGNIAASVLLYFGSLIGFFLINRSIIKVLKSGSELGIFDNILGFLFGALRGSFIVSLAYLMMSLVMKEDSRPDWLEKAVTRPYVEKGAVMLAKMAPSYTEELSNMQKKAKDSVQDSIKEKMEETIRDKLKNPDNINNIGNGLGNGLDNKQEDRPENRQENKPENNSGAFDELLKNLNKKP